MSLPGFAFVTPFILSQAEKGGVVFNISLYLAFPLSPVILAQGEKGGSNICLYLAFPLSLHLSYRKVRRGALTYVSTWLSLCYSIHLMAR